MAPAKFMIVLLAVSCAAAGQAAPDRKKVLDEAEKLFKAGDLEAVIRKLQPVVEKEPNLAEAQHGLGLAYYQQADFASAIRHLSAAIKLEREGSAPWRQTVEILAMAYYLSHRAQDALPLLEKAVTWSDSGNTNLLYTLAMAYLYTHDLDRSRKIFAQLFRIDADSPQAYMLAADFMIQEKYSADAEGMIREAQKRRPDIPEANYKLGLIAITKGDFSEAVQSIQKELACNPSHWLAWHYLGDAYIRLGKWDQAIEPLQHSIWLNLQSTRSYILLAKVYTQQEDYLVAENALKRALEMDPQNYEAHFLLGRVYHKSNRPEMAKKEIAVAEKLRRDSAGRK